MYTHSEKYTHKLIEIMTTSNTCTIQLLKKTYEIKCPKEEAENLQAAAQKLNDQLLANKKKFKSLDEFQTLLLAALTISHELVVCIKQQEQQRNQVSQFINALETNIDSVVRSESIFTPETD